MMSIKQRGFKYSILWVFGMAQPEIKPPCPWPLVNWGIYFHVIHFSSTRVSSVLYHLPTKKIMLRAILNKSWQQHPTRHQLYGHLPPITKTIQVRRTRHAGHCWRSRDELIRDVLLWIPTHGRAKAGRPARTYIQQLCEDTGCCPEDLPRAMNDREEWRERVRDIHAASTIWWWWWYIYHTYIIYSCPQTDPLRSIRTHQFGLI